MTCMVQKRFNVRPGVTLLETIVVLCIIALLLAFLLPAVQRGRDAARNASCKNNLHQIALATRQFWVLTKKLPNPAQPNVVNGWAIDILPFLEDRVFADQLAGNPSINQPSILQQISHRPLIMTCPFGWEGDSDIPSIPASHYAFSSPNPNYFRYCDVPLTSRVAWVASPEMDTSELPRDEGPHDGGYYIADSQGDVRWFAGK